MRRRGFKQDRQQVPRNQRTYVINYDISRYSTFRDKLAAPGQQEHDLVAAYKEPTELRYVAVALAGRNLRVVLNVTFNCNRGLHDGFAYLRRIGESHLLTLSVELKKKGESKLGMPSLCFHLPYRPPRIHSLHHPAYPDH